MTKDTTKNVNFDVFVVLWNQMQGFKTPKVHLKIIRWLQYCWDHGHTKMLLMAFRACGKSTLVGLFCAWLLLQNSSLRIIVLAADLNLARKMVRNVKKIIERHPLTKSLKPKNPDQWATDMFTVNSDLEMRDPSVLARSISANMTGSRADIFICDDVEVPNTCETADKRENLRDRLQEIDFVLVPGGRQFYVGTPHTYFSIYADQARKELKEQQPFLHGFERLLVPILNERGESAWPERFSLKKIDSMKKRSGPQKFNSQMMLRPVSINEGRLSIEELQFYHSSLDYIESGKQIQLRINDNKLVSASCWWDPAFRVPSSDGQRKGDSSVIAVVYTSEDGKSFIHDVDYLGYDENSQEDEATQQCRQVVEFLKRNYLFSVTIETNGLGKFLPGLLKKEIREQKYQASVLEKTNRQAKSIRILEAFDARLAARMLYVNERVARTPFLREMKEWRPNISGQSVDDGLDAVAGALLLEPVRIGSMISIGKQTSQQNITKKTWHGVQHCFDGNAEFDI